MIEQNENKKNKKKKKNNSSRIVLIYISIVVFIVLFCIMFGWIIPFLISAANVEYVILGFALLIIFPILAFYWTFKVVIPQIKKLTWGKKK